MKMGPPKREYCNIMLQCKCTKVTVNVTMVKDEFCTVTSCYSAQIEL
jgi:hypothetical protein